MLSKKVLNLKERYQNGRDNIGRDLVLTCLSECALYRRGSGFFSSSALKSYVDVIDRIIDGDVKIEILCSPIVQDRAVIQAIERNSSQKERINNIRKLSEEMVLLAVGFKTNPDRVDYRSKLLSYLIGSGKLEIRFAIPRDFSLLYMGEAIDNERNIYHVKDGYFRFPDGELVAFDGSFNESDSGLQHHVDRTQVYRSWVPEDVRRLEGIVEDIDADWNMENEYLSVYKISQETIDMVKRLSPTKRPKPYLKKDDVADNPKTFLMKLWKHQNIAVNKFLEEKQGVLEMATGTGKTTTALEIIRRLLESGKIDKVAVVTYGNDLLDQWVSSFDDWKSKNDSVQNVYVYRVYGKHKELVNFLNADSSAALVMGRSEKNFQRLFSSRSLNREKLLIIHDEIHGYGSKSLVNSLEGKHKGVAYRLGLSATPEREYDEVGTKFIENEVGRVIYQYPVEAAICDGILCEFDYVKLPYKLVQKDKENRQKVFARQAAASKEGQPWTNEKLYRELSKITKKASMKPRVLDQYLTQHKESIDKSIIFTLDQEQGDAISTIINSYTHNYRTYYQGTDSKFLEMLARGRIDSVIACERLNEGIDIPALKTVFLVSSDRAKLKTIQRIGRCLRKNPDDHAKRALVVDFVLAQEKADNPTDYLGADQVRAEWLETLSKVRYKTTSKRAER